MLCTQFRFLHIKHHTSWRRSSDFCPLLFVIFFSFSSSSFLFSPSTYRAHILRIIHFVHSSLHRNHVSRSFFKRDSTPSTSIMCCCSLSYSYIILSNIDLPTCYTFFPHVFLLRNEIFESTKICIIQRLKVMI